MLCGTAPSDYSGTITIGQSVKFELQTPGGVFSPMGTGKLVMTSGSATGGLQGTYSQFQARVTPANVTAEFGNDIEVTGSDYVNFNMLGGANIIASFDDLRVGNGQTIKTQGFSLLREANEFVGFDGRR